MLSYLFSESRFYFGSYYASHMVLQQQPSRAVVWGYGVVGAKVTVSVWAEDDTYSQQITAVSEGKKFSILQNVPPTADL